ncbi:hypothetical protein EON79_23690 [bacterium]|nr:MAG: hypothetical protein EON79_23690 [bacterium]
MLRKNLLALVTLTALVPALGQASDSFLSRALTAPHEEGRWANRRLTVRHHDQDAPRHSVSTPHEDSFLSRALTAPHDEGRWINRRLTLRHHEG